MPKWQTNYNVNSLKTVLWNNNMKLLPNITYGYVVDDYLEENFSLNSLKSVL